MSASYIRATPNEGETFKALTERLSIPYFRGSGYYQLIKSESISANKDLVLKKSSGWIGGGTSVRTELGLAKGKITIKPSDLPGNCELFVQSTSPNRKLPGGHDALFRLSAETASGDVIVSTAASSRTTTGKRKKGDDDDDDGGGGGDDGNSNNDRIVVWPPLMFTLTDDVDCLDEGDLVVGASASNVPGDCDLPVPNQLIQQAIDMVHNEALRAVEEWRETERLLVPNNNIHQWGEGTTHVRCQWRSSANGIRLMYVQSPNATFIALEVPQQNWGLVCGNCGRHPFAHSPHFKYANSDGSSNDIDLPLGHISPTTVLAKLIHDTVLHCSDAEH